MSANSFGSGCCETVRCDAAGIRGRCIPGGCFQDVLHGEIVFTCFFSSHLFLAQGLVGVVLLGTFQACPRLPSSEFLFVPKVNQEG